MSLAAPAVVSASSLGSVHAEPMTCALGALLTNVDLADAARDAALFDEIRALLVEHRVLFLHDQHMTRAEHVAFARRFGELEDHPVAGSDPDHPGLVRIYRGPESRYDRYENAWHCDTTWRERPQFGAVLRCTETPEVGGDMLKTHPRGFDADHPRIALLRHKSLTLGRQHGFGPEIHTPTALDLVREDWRSLRPLVEWAQRHVQD